MEQVVGVGPGGEAAAARPVERLVVGVCLTLCGKWRDEQFTVVVGSGLFHPGWLRTGCSPSAAATLCAMLHSWTCLLYLLAIAVLGSDWRHSRSAEPTIRTVSCFSRAVGWLSTRILLVA